MSDDVITIKEFMNDQFKRIEKQLEEIRQDLTSKERFDVWCNRITKAETHYNDVNMRVNRLERATWLLQALTTFMLPVVTAILIALLIGWLTGQITVSFK